MVGIDDVARRAGVSTATVSRALSGRGQVSPSTRERVVTAARELGYVVSASASSLASGRTRNIGLVVPYLDRWFFSTVLAGAAEALAKTGYDITLYALTEDPAHRSAMFATFLRRQRVDGLIAVSIELGDDEATELAALGVPVIAIGGPATGLVGRTTGLTSLTVDDVAVARLATEHLIGLGHRRIAHIGASPEFDVDFHLPTHRRQGFEQALQAAGIPMDADLWEQADFTIEGGHAAARRLLDRAERPTAIFAASDEMAVGALLAVRDAGLRVPEDVSIIGIDGHELSGFFRLTTVDQFPRRQGEAAAAAMVAELRHPDASVRPPRDLPFELVVRGTTAALV